MKSTKMALVLPVGAEAGSLLTLTYEDPESGPTPYHGIVLGFKKARGRHLVMVLILYWDDTPEYVAIDLNCGAQVGSISRGGEDNGVYKVNRLEICDPGDILGMIGDEGYYDKGPPRTIPIGRIESSRRRH
jgi:hypothetical protein